MSEFKIKAGTRMFFGAPARPMPEEMADAIAEVVTQVPGVVEAHLPQCYIQGDKEARQILVIGVLSRGEIQQIAQALMARLQPLFASGQFIDLLPFEVGAIPAGIREAGCQIFPVRQRPQAKPVAATGKKAWWKFW